MNLSLDIPVFYTYFASNYIPDLLNSATSTYLPNGAAFVHSGQHLQLLPEKAIFWEEEDSLLLSDLHLGKAGHFRKAGIPIPPKVHVHDLERLTNLIRRYLPKKVIFLGDLFHSELNNEWWTFLSWLEQFHEIRFILIKGNHDILPKQAYEAENLDIVEKELAISPFLLTHEPLSGKNQKEGFYTISGHIHPAVVLKGAGLQRISLACFYFGLHNALLPAFGKFTGFCKIKPKLGEAVFAITENCVLRL